MHPEPVARLALAWAGLKDPERVAECARQAELRTAASRTSSSRPCSPCWAKLGVRLGDVQKGLAHYDEAMARAGQLTNPRPRALACVDICLSLERAALRHRQVSEGLNRLLALFGAAQG